MNILLPDVDDRCAETWLSILQHRVADRYQVSPIDSAKAFEDIKLDSGEIAHVPHRSFVYAVPDNSETSLATAVELMWSDISSMFSVGTFVIWRIRPVIKEVEEPCPSCGGVSKKYIVRCRIGALNLVQGVDTSSKEYEEVKTIPIIYARSV